MVKIKKRDVMMSFMIFIILIDIIFIFGLTCKDKDNNDNTDYTIMKLYQDNNSHGALYNDTNNYNVDICYYDIFTGATKTYDSTSHICKGTNAVLWLSNETNAHASNDTFGIYTTPVCFGDLICRSVENSVCAADEKAVVKLWSVNNSHISNASSSINYPINICCKDGVLPVSGNAEWQNMDGIGISSAELYDSVKLVLNREGISHKNINYTIYKINGNNFLWWHWDKQLTPFSSFGIATWKTNETGNFSFNATVEGSLEIYSSNTLEVNDIEDNKNPTISINKPVENSTFIIGTEGLTNNIPFEQNASDEDDLLDIYWNFDDKNTTKFSNCNNGVNNCNTTHQYNISSAGTKIINAMAKESTRSQSEYDLSRVYVYKEGLVLFVILDKPDYKTTVFPPIPITIDASSTYVANCSRVNATCQASLPIGQICNEINDSVYPINKTYCYIYANSTNPKFKFKWFIDGETKPEYPINSSPFTKMFPRGGTHVIGLDVTFNMSA